jgi:hypothetical protein
VLQAAFAAISRLTSKQFRQLLIGSEPTQQPDHFDIASGFSFEPPARLQPVKASGEPRDGDDGQPVGAGSTPSKLISAKSSASTNTSNRDETSRGNRAVTFPGNFAKNLATSSLYPNASFVFLPRKAQ